MFLDEIQFFFPGRCPPLCGLLAYTTWLACQPGKTAALSPREDHARAHEAVARRNTSRLAGGPLGVQQQLTPEAPGKKGTPEPAPLGAVVGEHWRARSVLGTLPDGQKTGLFGGL